VVFSLVICVTQLLALLVLICVYQPWFLLGSCSMASSASASHWSAVCSA